MSEAEYIELRVAYPGQPYVALIVGLDALNDLNRSWVGDYLYHRREHVGDGKQEQVYRLPLRDAVYEIREKINGKRAYRYVAVLHGVPRLHRLTRDLVERVAEGTMSLKQVVTKLADEPGGGPR
jgi:hypothetical protein